MRRLLADDLDRVTRQPGTGRSERGTFVLSLDTEIAWGTFDHGGLHAYAAHFDAIRPIVQRLVDLLDAYQVPATWAFVGHLLLDRCDKMPDGTTHPTVLRPSYRWYPHDWHHLDPGTDVHRDPWWYGPDLLETVMSAQVSHEIGTHTFSHIVVDDPDCTRPIFRSQIDACISVHRQFGLPIDSIVFPRNGVAFLDVLAEEGITVYRGVERRRYLALDGRIVKPLRILDRVLAFPPPTYPLAELWEGDLINVPASMFLLSRDGFRRLVPLRSRVVQARRGLQRAARRGELFHLWFHPFNLHSDSGLFDALEAILQHAAALRDAGDLSILTMKQAADVVRHVHAAGSRRDPIRA